MMGCETPLQIPIVLPSLCFRGNSLLPSGRPSSLNSSHFPLMGFSHVLLPSHFLFLSVLFLFLFSQKCFFTFLCSNLILSPVFNLLTVAFSYTFHCAYSPYYCTHSFAHSLLALSVFRIKEHFSCVL